MKSDGPLEENTIPFVYRAKITDHYAVGMQTVFGLRKPYYQHEMVGHERNIHYKDLKKNLSFESWNSLEYMKNAEDITEEFINLLQGHIAVCTRTMRIPKKQRKKQNWITQSWVNRIQESDNMFKRVKESQDTELVNRYNEYSKQIKSDVKMGKQEYYRNKITQDMNNPKEMWKTVNVFSGRRNEGSRWHRKDSGAWKGDH
ncbi:hypothetical protein HHI36_010621 [Cryptolaemus montrouzieri]|uniref:Uncharacterized protein n=1 Tax=Cryptolaemus montrouzieri TaxID=559131 RepID=A0ABD2MJC6_9CUCU